MIHLVMALANNTVIDAIGNTFVLGTTLHLIKRWTIKPALRKAGLR